MKKGLLFFGLGAGLMFLLDPRRGARRRALMLSKSIKMLHRVDHYLNKISRDLNNRMHGLFAEINYKIKPEEQLVDDDVLAARVRAKLGHIAHNSHSIYVSAHDGRVTLSGAALADEAKEIVERIIKVRGVKEVIDRLKPQAEPGREVLTMRKTMSARAGS
jgi:hypothetical protein